MIPGLFALGIWPLLPPLLFYYFRPHVAALLTLLSAVMFLPEGVGFNLPLLPTMGKDQISSVVCMVCCVAFAPAKLLQSRPLRGLELLVVPISVGGLFSIALNQEALRYGMFVVPGTELTGVMQEVLSDWILWGFPFLIGRAYFTRSEELRDLFVILILAGLVYSLLILIEVRLSPQLHRWIYGSHQHAFIQTIRPGGGYRPMVFMRHGLNLSFFVVMCMSSAWVLARTRHRLPILPSAPKLAIALYLTVVLLLCQSTASTLYGVLMLGLVGFVASSRIRMWVAVSLAAISLLYPAIRSLQILPVKELVQVVEENLGRERAGSMAARLLTEEELMVFVQARPFFGWGSAGRAMIIDEFTGENKTTFDGFWLIQSVTRGMVGFIGLFALFLLPVFAANKHLGAIRSKQDRIMISGLSLMVAFHVFDLLPNSPTESYLTLLSGALSGGVAGILREQSLRSRARREGQSLAERLSAGGDSGPGSPATPGQKPTLGRDLLDASGPRKPRRSKKS